MALAATNKQIVFTIRAKNEAKTALAQVSADFAKLGNSIKLNGLATVANDSNKLHLSLVKSAAQADKLKASLSGNIGSGLTDAVKKAERLSVALGKVGGVKGGTFKIGSLEKSVQDAKALGAAINTLSKTMAAVGKAPALSTLKTQLAAVAKAAKEANAELAKLKIPANLGGSLGLTEADARKLSEALRQVSSTAATMSTRSFSDMRRQIGDLQREVGTLKSNIDKMGDGFSAAGRHAGGLLDTVRQMVPLMAGMSFANVAGDALDVFRSFEKQMKTIQAVRQGTEADLQLLTTRARELGAATVFTAREVAQGMEYMARSGLQVDQIYQGIPHTLNLAAAGGLNLARATDISVQAMMQFGMSASQMEEIADTFAYMSAESNVNVEELGETLKYAGSIADLVGVSFRETTAAIAAMADGGIRGSMAGTALRKVLTSLSAPTKGGADAIKALGLSLDEVNPAKVGGLANALRALKNAGIMDGNTTKYIKDIFGQYALGGSANVIKFIDKVDKLSGVNNKYAESSQKAGEASQSFFQKVRAAYDGITGAASGAESKLEGSAGRMAAIMIDNLDGAIKILRSTVEEVYLRLISDTTLAPILTGIVRFTTDVVKAFFGMRDQIEGSYVVVTAAATALKSLAAAAAVFVAFKAYAAAIWLTNAAMAAFNATAMAFPLARPIALLAVAATVAMSLNNVLMDIAKGIGQISFGLGKEAVKLADFFTSFSNGFREGFQGTFDFLRAFGQVAVRVVSDALQGALNVLNRFLGTTFSIDKSVLPTFENLGRTIGVIAAALAISTTATLTFRAVSLTLASISAIYAGIGGSIALVTAALRTSAAAVVAATGATLTYRAVAMSLAAVQGVYAAVTGAVATLTGALRIATGANLALSASAWANPYVILAAGIGLATVALFSFASSSAEASESVKGVGTASATAAVQTKSNWQLIKDGVAADVASIKATLAGMWNSLVSGASSAVSSVVGYFSSMGQSVVLTVQNALNSVVGVFWSMVESVREVVDTVANYFSDMGDRIVGVFSTAVSRIQSVWNSLTGTTSQATQSMADSADQAALAGEASFVEMQRGITYSFEKTADTSYSAFEGIEKAAGTSASGVEKAFGGTEGFFSGLVSRIAGFFSSLWDSVKSMAASAASYMSSIMSDLSTPSAGAARKPPPSSSSGSSSDVSAPRSSGSSSGKSSSSSSSSDRARSASSSEPKKKPTAKPSENYWSDENVARRNEQYARDYEDRQAPYRAAEEARKQALADQRYIKPAQNKTLAPSTTGSGGTVTLNLGGLEGYKFVSTGQRSGEYAPREGWVPTGEQQMTSFGMMDILRELEDGETKKDAARKADEIRKAKDKFSSFGVTSKSFVFHDGGKVGSLKPGEVDAVLMKNEEVLTEERSRQAAAALETTAKVIRRTETSRASGALPSSGGSGSGSGVNNYYSITINPPAEAFRNEETRRRSVSQFASDLKKEITRQNERNDLSGGY
jgi:TP901 family phage tail tape measure protein